MTAVSFTTFDRAVMPSNVLTVTEWRHFSRAVYKNVSWQTAAKKYAMQCGGALVWRADDSLVVFTRRKKGLDIVVSRSTYKPGTWGWDK